ncbi:hypothetical protein OQA88_3342 [Cercophora sp. LCS_1]
MKMQCDGQPVCARCKEVGEQCEYDHNRRESKGELRAETARLKKSTADSDTLLRVIAAIPDPYVCQAVLCGLMDGKISRSDILRDFPSETESASSSNTGPSPAAFRPQPTRTPYSCFDQLLSWRTCRAHPRHVDMQTESQEAASALSTILSLPPLPPDAHTAHSQPDSWTRTGWTRAHILHLVDALRTWDYLPFCFFSEDLFMRDYESGSGQFCSSALVHAILALSSRLINEGSDESGLLPSGWLRSRLFADEAKALIKEAEHPRSLPDIQALGILSLYHLRCGNEVEAGKQAEAFLSSITELCQDASASSEGDEYASVRVTTYCGAVTLVRMLALTTGRIFNVDNTSVQDDLFTLDQLPSASLNSDGLRPNLSANIGTSRPWNIQLVAASLFQLTELVYQLIVSAQTDLEGASKDIAARYSRCLNWYTDFFKILAPDGGRTPFVLFIHMYYHFCLLCVFRPFVGLVLERTDLWPHKICTQATQSILALGQSYDDLFTLRRVSGLIPYFVATSGLFSLAMEDGGSKIDDIHLRSGDEASHFMGIEKKDGEEVISPDGTSFVPSHLKMSMGAHARLLLAKISSTHPAAAIADQLMRAEIGPETENGDDAMDTTEQ